MATLNTTNSSGTQTSTQSPQTSAPSTSGASDQSGDIQPGTASDLLRNTQGISLQPTPLTTVSLGASTQASSAAKLPEPRHINVGLLGFSVVLFAAAIVLFWVTSRSANNTTY